MPPSAPSPGRTSATVRRSGRQLGASGALATSRGGSPSASVITRTSRSRIRPPPPPADPGSALRLRTRAPSVYRRIESRLRQREWRRGAAGPRGGGAARQLPLISYSRVESSGIDCPAAPQPPRPALIPPPPPSLQDDIEADGQTEQMLE